MAINEKRRYARVNALNLSYICIDEDGRTVNEGMGRTLNVSEGGILLETNFCILKNQNLLLTIAVEDSLLDVKGKVIRCGKDENNRFHTGIEFTDLSQSARFILKQFIEIFQKQENKDNI